MKKLIAAAVVAGTVLVASAITVAPAFAGRTWV